MKAREEKEQKLVDHNPNFVTLTSPKSIVLFVEAKQEGVIINRTI
jgi:hypothetical protein